MTWQYQNSDFTDPNGYYGFVYLLTFNDNTKYIGKKDFYTNRLLPALASGKQRPNSTRIGKNKNNKRVYFDLLKAESNWKTYRSSSRLLGDRTIVAKQILALATSKRQLTYLETKYLFTHEVLEKSEYLNENILGKFFKSIQ